jgi:ADP-ribosylation factor protein 6
MSKDIGGQEKIRLLWPHYFEGTDGVIFVVDSHDQGRIAEAKNELHQLAAHIHMKNVFILILANKSDLPNVTFMNSNLTNVRQEMIWS